MQDIGGCRAILRTKKQISKTIRILKRRKDFRVKDYIVLPKEDGYRGIHLIGNFSKKGGEKRSIEIQLRTKIQHSWATAVEIIDLFTGQAIKSNRGTEEWKNFFRAVSDVFSQIDSIINYERLPNAQLDHELLQRLANEEENPQKLQLLKTLETTYTSIEKLDVIGQFEAFAQTLKITDDRITREMVRGYVLLVIDIKEHQLESTIFDESDFDSAAKAYLEAEKNFSALGGRIAALVSTDAVGGLKEAYPNYFADSTMFLRLLVTCSRVYKKHNPSKLSRTIKKLFH